MFVRRHQMSCRRFRSFPAGLLVAFWNSKSPLAVLLLLANQIVQYQSKAIITRTVSCHGSSWDIMSSHYVLKGHSASGQRGSPWSSPLRSDGSRDHQAWEAGPVEPLLYWIRVKGTTQLPLQWGSIQGGQTGDQRAELKGYSYRGIYSRGELDNSSKPNRTRARGSRSENTSPLIRKSYSLFLWVMVKRGVADDDDNDDQWEPVEPVTRSCDSVPSY